MALIEIGVVVPKRARFKTPEENLIGLFYDLFYEDNEGKHLFTDEYKNFLEDDLIFYSYAEAIKVFDNHIEACKGCLSKNETAKAFYSKDKFVKDFKVEMKNFYATFGYIPGAKVMCLNITNGDIISPLCTRDYTFVEIVKYDEKKKLYYAKDEDDTLIFAHSYKDKMIFDERIFMTISEARRFCLDNIDKLERAADELRKVVLEVTDNFSSQFD